MGIMEKKMETTIWGLGLRASGLGSELFKGGLLWGLYGGLL